MKLKATPIACAALIGAVMGITAFSASAQNWPQKSIKLIAPSTAGGPPDTYARALAEHLSKELGQPVVVENMPATGGMVAAQQIMKATPDGYTLLVNTAGMMTITPQANPLAKYTPNDFTQICQGVEAALVLGSNSSLGLKDMAQLTKWIKSQKPAPTYSSYSPGSPAHFLGYQLGEELKVDMTHVPYKSSPQQISDMIGNISPLGFVQISTAVPHIKSGKLTPYATTGEKRSTQLPDVPTVKEVGLPSLTTTVWFGLSAPKNLPTDILQKITAAHQRMMNSAEFNNRMNTSNLTPTPDVCGEVFMKRIQADTSRWGRIVKATGFTAND